MIHSNEQDERWRRYVASLAPEEPFSAQLAAYREIYAERRAEDGPPLAWRPEPEAAAASNLGRWMAERVVAGYGEFHRWSATARAEFWGEAIARLGIVLARRPEAILDDRGGPADPRWLPGARLNIAESCFGANPAKTAIVSGREGSADLSITTYGQLDGLAARFADGLRRRGLPEGVGVALVMPMTVECVAAYLGAVRAGHPVVSIADSFPAAEIARRLEIGGAELVVTVESFGRGGKIFPLYQRICQAGAPAAVVVPSAATAPTAIASSGLRCGDLAWAGFLGDAERVPPAVGDPHRVTNVLFSSGTTATPKAIPWTHLTPIKCAMDGRFHLDVGPGDVVAWPTNIGWMMGPWLIYASLINRAAIALYDGAPTGDGFARFVKRAGVTVLGTVPSLVRAWRSAAGDTGWADWRRVRVFSSTGEPSDREDYLWLMSRAGYRAPVVEYCGGTEIGGGHITGTVVQPASPATFTTPALGLDFVLLDEDGRPVEDGEAGELYLVPPSVGLSQTLLNADHRAVYYEGCPRGPGGETLRRHGDRVARLANGFFRAQGRVDDAMNLSGIKVGSLEIERVVDGHPAVRESAAVGVQPGGEGPERLVVYAVVAEAAEGTGEGEGTRLRAEVEARIAGELNPLFKVADLVVVEALPRTASNKLMRRELRRRYLERRR